MALVQNITVGIGLGLVSAFFFSATTAGLSRQLTKVDPKIVNYMSTLVGMVLLLVASGVTLQLGTLLAASPLTFLAFIIVGASQFGLARYFSFVALKHIGANQSHAIIPTQVLYSFLFAVLILKERLLPLTLLGGVLVAIGPFVAEAGKGAKVRSGDRKKGIVSASMTGLIFGVTPILINIGFSTYSYYLPATFVSYFGAVAFNSLMSNPKGVMSQFAKLKRSSALIVLLGGISTSFGQLSRFGALSFAPVVVVVPFIALYPTFTLLLTFVFMRDVEAFGYRTVLSLASATIGAFLVAYSG